MFEKVKEMVPKWYGAYVLAAKALEGLGDLKAAEYELKQAIEWLISEPSS